VALAEKPSSVGDVLGDVVGIAHRRISSDSVKGTPFARDDVVRVLRDTYGRSRQVDVRMVPHQESRSPDDVGWWRRRWRWAIGDLDDSIIERLADDLLVVALDKDWIKKLKDGPALPLNLGFDDYYSTDRRSSWPIGDFSRESTTSVHSQSEKAEAAGTPSSSNTSASSQSHRRGRASREKDKKKKDTPKPRRM